MPALGTINSNTLVDGVRLGSINSATEITSIGSSLGSINSGSEITSPSSLLTDLISYYKLDETSGAVIDSHGGNNGSNTGATTGNGGILGNSYGFGGSLYVNIDACVASLSGASQGTISVWVRPSDVTPPNARIIVSFGDTDANESIRLFQLTNGKLGIAVTDGGSNRWRIETNSAVLTDNVWSHIAVVQDGTPVLYIDGVAPAQSYTVSVDLDAWFSECTGIDNGRIGCLNAQSSGNTLNWGGLIDEVGFWNRPLTTDELTELYNGGSGLAYPFDGSGGSGSTDEDGVQVEKALGGSSGAPMGFLQYLPDDYSLTSDTYPCIIFLHGAGERGNGSTELDLVDNHGIPLKIKNGWNAQVGGEKFIVLSPQQSSSYNGFIGNPSDAIPNDALEFALWALNDSGLRIDPTRLYLTGFSMGTPWYAAGFNGDIDGVPYTNIFAAIAPVSAGGEYADGQRCGNRGIPVWAFHGDADSSVPLSDGQRPINGFNSVGGSPTPIFTIYSGLGHSSAVWDTRAYAIDNTYHTPNLYEWFLTHSL